MSISRKWVLLVVLITTCAVFFPSLQNGFTGWDDNIYITENELISAITVANVEAILTSPLSGNYHPLTMLVSMFEYSLFGNEALGYHVVSLVLHLVNVFLVFWFVRILTKSDCMALVVCFLFAVHPTKMEPVAWIADQKDLLSSLFLLLMLIVYSSYRQSRRVGSFVCALLLFVMSFLAKANGLFYPFILLLIDYYEEERISLKALKEKTPFFLVSAIFGTVAIVARQSYQSNLLEGMFSWFDTACLGLHRLVFYFLFRTVIPLSHSWLYPQPHKVFPPPAFIASAALVIILLAVALFYWARRCRALHFGFLFFLLGLFPVLTVAIIGHTADRFTYLPSIGIYFIVAYGLSVLSAKSFPHGRSKQIMGATLFLPLALLLVVSTWQSAHRWKDGIALWSAAISDHEKFSLAYYNRAESYYRDGEHEKAVADLGRAIEIEPAQYKPYFLRGLVFFRKRQYPEAIADFSEVVEIKKDDEKSYNFRGLAHQLHGDDNAAMVDFSQAVRINPEYADAYHNRGALYYEIGALVPACNDLRQACKLGVCNYLQSLHSRGLCR